MYSVQNICNFATYCFPLEGERCGEKQHVSQTDNLPSNPVIRKMTIALAFGIGPDMLLAPRAYLPLWITLQRKAEGGFAWCLSCELKEQHGTDWD